MSGPTDTEQLLKALGADFKNFRKFLNFFPLGVIITDRDGRIVYYNRAQADIDGLEPKEVIGRVEVEVLTPVAGPNLMNVCQKTGQPILGYIFPYRTFKGREVNATYWAYPVFEKGRVVGAVCFTQPLAGENIKRGYGGRPIQWPGSEAGDIAPNIVGVNRAFQKALQAARGNAANPFPVLISGETGSGKEMLAKLIHLASPRNKAPYLALNCAAIPGQLLESLLFGTVKGSFTGSIDRPGLMEEAAGGTLYLDEIDSMPLELQPKLLRAIQEMRISRVGSSAEIDLDFKLVGSIGSSPQEALSAGSLRADLFYRLAVVVVNIPPLRERPDDLEPLTAHFLDKYNGILGKGAVELDSGLWRMMRAYHWPGNVRELEHMLAGTLAQMGNESVIGLRHVPDHYIQAFAKAGGTAAGRFAPFGPKRSEARPETPGTGGGPVERLKREEEQLRQALVESGGNVTRAAALVGVSRQLFSYRMLKFGLNRLDFKGR